MKADIIRDRLNVLREIVVISPEIFEALDELERMASKQEQAKIRLSTGKNFAWCPVCDLQHDLTYCVNYCYGCGQKLDWSGLNEI